MSHPTRRWLTLGLIFALLAPAAPGLTLSVAAPPPASADPQGLSTPPVRTGHALAYDSARAVTVLFGGYDGTRKNDTWEWDGAEWTQRAPATSPPARSSHAMAYDSARGVAVLFGGHDSSGAVGDTWEWDGTEWVERTPAHSPPARWGHALAYDSVRARTVLFGGCVSDDKQALLAGGWEGETVSGAAACEAGAGDTWEWDGADWVLRSPAARPAARYGHALAYDAGRGVTVLFGGYDGSSRLGDTWVWDGADWTQRSPGTSPPARTAHALAYDAGRGVTVLFGGRAGDGYRDDTWEWDGTGWLQRSPTRKALARGYHALACDAARGVTVLFGGWAGRRVNDTWEWDGAEWTAGTGSYFVVVKGDELWALALWAAPQTGVYVDTAASASVGDFDNDGALEILAVRTTDRLMRMYKGDPNSGFTSQVVSDDAYPPTNYYASNPGSAVGDWDGNGWLDLAFGGRRCSSTTCSPGGEDLLQLHLNQGDGTFLHLSLDVSGFTGRRYEGTGGLAEGDFNGDSLLDLAIQHYWDGPHNPTHLFLGNGDGTFAEEVVLTSDAGGGAPSLIAGDFDENGALDLILGQDDDKDAGQTWLYLGDGAGGFVYAGKAYDTNPSCESGTNCSGNGFSGSYDLDRDGHLDAVAAAFELGLFFFPGNGDGTFGEATLLSPDGRCWLVELPPVVGPLGPRPAVRTGHALAYDAGRGVTVLFGGYNVARKNDTWEWDGAEWAQRAPATSPPARSSHALAYDSTRGVTVLFGGYGSGGFLGDTWEWDGVDWVERSPAHSPLPRWGHALAYDSARGTTVLFGGCVSPSAGATLGEGWEWEAVDARACAAGEGDTWEWDGTDWTQRSPATKPPARYGHALAYDAGRGVTVLFGGRAWSSFRDDTWEWDGADWAKRSPAAKPTARYAHALAYDGGRGVTVLFAGQGSDGTWGDTWEWDGAEWLLRSPTTAPAARAWHALTYDSARGQTVLFGGWAERRMNDTWEWDSAEWAQVPPSSPSAPGATPRPTTTGGE